MTYVRYASTIFQLGAPDTCAVACCQRTSGCSLPTPILFGVSQLPST